ncbi:hypothetical protein [Chitinophaga sp. 212800010-3]|uniref:hypothetical protein n=1 Tax=unclassified Chitinophaga TaxID=2619133 RepID=UPI002DEC3F6F|nr:Fibronectin type-III domain-containing protein [Chitinophaga sp. 212800010-3]
METQTLVELTASTLYTTTLVVSNVAADSIDVDYTTMPGNQPNTYGNFLAIWQNAGSIPWNTDPLKTFPIPTNTPSGSANFGGLDINNSSYIIGYAVGPTLNPTGSVQKYGNICGTATIPEKSTGENTIFTSGISEIKVGTTSFSFQFDLPDGVLPQSNGAWAGVWRGENPSYYSTPPQASIALTPNFSSGRAAFNNISIGRGQTYTVAIFMSGLQTGGSNTQRALACSATFKN